MTNTHISGGRAVPPPLVTTANAARAALARSPAAGLAAADALLAERAGDLVGLALRARALGLLGDARGDAALTAATAAAARDPGLLAAGDALAEDRLAPAERALKERLRAAPEDFVAIRMLAELATRLGRYGDAERLLTRCLELVPQFDVARHNLAVILYRQARAEPALAEVNRLLARDPDHPAYRNLKAAILVRIGDYPQAIAIYRAVLDRWPAQPKVWMSLGHALKTVGDMRGSIAAYRRAIEGEPTLGEAWWSLANLKSFRFGDADFGAMTAALARADLAQDDRFHFAFALGKAHEDRGADAAAFARYAEGNRLRRAAIDHDPAELADQVARAERLFTPAFFAARAGQGCPAPDPIFVVGLPRSGSTLVEQILASHPLIEGTMELPDLPALARTLDGRRHKREKGAYPERLGELSEDELRALGEDYLATTRIQRHTDRPFFVDKLPNNFAHVGMIHLILPNARVIDVRRHPLGCCFSGFKQHFARGQAFTYDLAEIGRHYADYVRLMAHIDAVLPGRVHRVIYERLVVDMPAAVRALLAHVGVPFDPACLRFHETDRAIRTPSAEQVRRPIFTDALDHWRRFEPWLDPLKVALGPVLDAYPDAPRFA